MRLSRWTWCSLAIASSASAQSFNIDFGAAGSAPASTYGAAGSPGVWNVIGVLPGFSRTPLVDLQGAAGSVELYMYGGSSLALLAVDDAGTQGDDAALMDDMLIGSNDPVDVCVWIDGLEPGEYEVLTYALTPGESTRECRVRVDFADQGETMIGGPWPGQMTEGTTHARHTVTSGNGRIGLHSGLYNGYLQSGINGVQVRPTALLGVEATRPRDAWRLVASPDPGRSTQWLVFSGPPTPGGSVIIHDVSGRAVWSAAVDAAAAETRIAWPGVDLAGGRIAPGVYVAHWRDREGRRLASRRLARVR